MTRAPASVAKDDGGREGDEVKVGNIYSVKVITGDAFNGIVLAYDPDPNFIIFEEGMKPRPRKSKTLRMVNADYVTEINYLRRVKDPLYNNSSLDLDGLQAKETDAIWNIERIGIGVTEEAQLIFDMMSKTLDLRWDNTDMVAMEQVFIRSPYHSACVSGGTRVVCDRVKSVLNQVRKKLELSET